MGVLLTAKFKIHNPSRRKREVMDTALEEYTHAYAYLLNWCRAVRPRCRSRRDPQPRRRTPGCGRRAGGQAARVGGRRGQRPDADVTTQP